MKKIIIFVLLAALVLLTGCETQHYINEKIIYNETIGFCKQICESHNTTYLDYRSVHMYRNDVCVCNSTQGIITHTV